MEGLGNHRKVSKDLSTTSHRVVTLLGSLFVLLLSHVDRGTVQEVDNVLRVQLLSLRVVGQCCFELALVVRSVAQLLLCKCLLLLLLLGTRLIVLLGRGSLLFFCFALLSGRLPLIVGAGVHRGGRGAILGLGGHRDAHLLAQYRAEHLHEDRVLHVVVEMIRIGGDVSQHRIHTRLCHERRSLWIGFEFRDHHRIGKESRHRLSTLTTTLLHQTFQPALQSSIVRIDLQTSLIGLLCIFHAPQSVKSSRFSKVSLGPIGLEFDHFLGVLQSVLILLCGGIDGRSIGEEDMITVVQLDRLGKALDRLFVVLGSERLVAFVLEIDCAGHFTRCRFCFKEINNKHARET
mmetsp:Transcript_37799/g.95020  ORF Transcript_37799/g.95020 Transcript_37799/m.95020 type:complete len:347 (+) Transcript_37799:732-1772(+)